jgi:hypothetical protein
MSGCDGSGLIDDLDEDGRKYWRCEGCDACRPAKED